MFDDSMNDFDSNLISIKNTPLAQASRADLGGAHAPKTHRGPVVGDAEFPPGVVCYEGHPTNASPFLQAQLPAGFKCENKKSKAVSFKTADTMLVRGTNRSRDQAKMIILGWSWQWFNGLTLDQRSSLQGAAAGSETPAAKRRRV